MQIEGEWSYWEVAVVGLLENTKVTDDGKRFFLWKGKVDEGYKGTSENDYCCGRSALLVATFALISFTSLGAAQVQVQVQVQVQKKGVKAVMEGSCRTSTYLRQGGCFGQFFDIRGEPVVLLHIYDNNSVPGI